MRLSISTAPAVLGALARPCQVVINLLFACVSHGQLGLAALTWLCKYSMYKESSAAVARNRN